LCKHRGQRQGGKQQAAKGLIKVASFHGVVSWMSEGNDYQYLGKSNVYVNVVSEYIVRTSKYPNCKFCIS
jgi:hypothetical protein